METSSSPLTRESRKLPSMAINILMYLSISVSYQFIVAQMLLQSLLKINEKFILRVYLFMNTENLVNQRKNKFLSVKNFASAVFVNVRKYEEERTAYSHTKVIVKV
uniref:Uncharacterized protein n=1 Tax=Glossina brevipalpis TaxID=37001 RepID=A0A1A9WZK5_9MUSC